MTTCLAKYFGIDDVPDAAVLSGGRSVRHTETNSRRTGNSTEGDIQLTVREDFRIEEQADASKALALSPVYRHCESQTYWKLPAGEANIDGGSRRQRKPRQLHSGTDRKRTRLNSSHIP